MKIRHVVNGDPGNGWYCYQCSFFTRDVVVAAKHDGSPEVCPQCDCRVDADGCGCDPPDA